MLTTFTQTAIAVLSDIDCGGFSRRALHYEVFPCSLSDLLNKLEYAGLIRLLPHHKRGEISSYILTREANEISLLDVLNAIDEPLGCGDIHCDRMYCIYPIAANRLGALQQVMRKFLSDISLTDF